MSANKSVPCCCLIPGDVGLAELDEAASEAKRIEAATSAKIQVVEVSGLADRLIRIAVGAAGSDALAAALTEVLLHLRDAQEIGDDEQASPFVLLVPSKAAPVVIGTRGARVRDLMQESGAEISVSRDVIGPLSSQPVIITGTVTQVVAASTAIQEVVQDLVHRSRVPGREVAALTGVGDSQSPAVGASPAGPPNGYTTPVSFLVTMKVAGFIIGKAGRNIAELQSSTGASISVETGPGLCCGDRIVCVTGEGRDAGVQAVLATLAKAPSTGRVDVALIVPAESVGFVIGRGGQTLADIRRQSVAEVNLDDIETPIDGSRVVRIAGSPDARERACLAVVRKIDELQGRTSSPSTADVASIEVALSSRMELVSKPPRLELESKPARRPVAPPKGLPVDNVPGAVPLQASRSPGTSAPVMDPQKVPKPLGLMAQSLAEREVLDGIRNSGVFTHRLTIHMPNSTMAHLDEISQRSGARFEDPGQPSDRGHRFITAVGSQLETSLAALYIQQAMAVSGDEN